LRVPRQANARGHILTMIVVDVAAIVAHVTIRWLGLSGRTDFMVSLVLNVLPLASWVFLMLFLKGLAAYLGRTGSASEAESLLFSGLFMLGTWYYWPLIVRGLVFVLFCFGLLVAVGLFIWLLIAGIRLFLRYYNLLVDLRDAVA
jgi:hypothetical protein